MRVLLVEDNDAVANALVDVLGANGHRPTWCRLGADALTSHQDADVVLLDLGLPDIDGLEVLRRLRRISTVPVLVLTARGDERTVVRGLRGGADDYLVKAAGEPAEPVVRVTDLSVDLDARTVRVAGQPVELTTKEFDVLAVLARKAGTAVSRQQIMDQVWGDAYLAVSRSLDVHMTTLRAKLDRPELLHTIRGYGYRLG
jgi:DNA-binding response OmpR family regulator